MTQVSGESSANSVDVKPTVNSECMKSKAACARLCNMLQLGHTCIHSYALRHISSLSSVLCCMFKVWHTIKFDLIVKQNYRICLSLPQHQLIHMHAN